MDDKAWDLVVIGGGSAGLIAACTVRLLGGHVLLTERARLGGDCLWTGCVPSKALIAEARTAAASGRAGGPDHAAAETVFRAVRRAGTG